MRVTGCKTNHITNPLGFDLGTPRVSWKVEDAAGRRQTSARVVAAKDEAMTQVVYDSGESAELSSLAHPIRAELEPYTRYFWQVRVQSDAGESAMSEPSRFETAKLNEPWEADWIGCPELETENPVFVKVLKLPEEVPDARAYVCGLGVYEWYLNGERVGDEYLAPGCTDYNMRLQYQTYAVNLKKGRNVLAVSLGNGWYKGRFGLGRHDKVYGDAFHLIFELRKGGRLLAKTDASWQVYAGDIGENGIYDGEVYAPNEQTKRSADAHEAFRPVTVEDRDKSILCARLSLPVRIRQTRSVQEVIHTPAGETVLDLGQNMVGFMRFRVHEPAGQTVRLQYGEILQDGNFYNDNLRTAKAEYVYISDGRERIVSPHFTFYGFRYVKVEGITGELKPEDFTGCVLGSDYDEIGSVTTDNAKLNQLISNVIWGQRGNYVDIPTDCPQRDERLGWTGDTQVFSGTASFLTDSYAFLNKYLVDVYATQREIGCVPSFIPAFDDHDATSCAWGDVATIVPWTLYLFSGDEEILRQQFDSMCLWADYMYGEDEKNGGRRLWVTDTGYGDWLALDHDDPKERMSGGTELTYLSSAYYYYSTRIVARAAEILGFTDEAARYGKRADEIREAFQTEYFTRTGRLAVNTQTAYAVALYMDLAPEEAKAQTAKALADKIKNGGGHLKTGFIGTPILCRVLSSYGYSDTAYRLLFNEDVPSWLYAVNLGATTIWERWNSVLPDGHINGTDMNSLNHYSYGSIVEWMFRHMAGIQPLEEAPGFKRVRIAPEINVRLKRTDMVYDSAAGRYEVHWRLHGSNEVEVDVTVPFDAQAELILPGKEAEPLRLEAGSYTYRYQTKEELFQRANTWSSFQALREYPPAAPLLDQYMPGWSSIPAMFCKDSLRDMSKTPFVHISEEDMDKIDAALA